MSADIIQTQYDRLAVVTQQYAQQAEAVAVLQQHVERTAQTLRQGGWEGRGAASFGAEMDTVVLPVMHRLHAAFVQAHTVTSKIAEVMRQAEEEAARPLKGTWVGAARNAGKSPGLAAMIPERGRLQPDPYVIDGIRQTDLSVFFSQYEDSDVMSSDVLDRYLTNPQMMAFQKNLTSALVDRVRHGDAPLTPESLYQLALQGAGDPGTALIVAHNVTKALARGRSPIPWEKVSDDPLVYRLNGADVTFEPASFHSDAGLVGSRGRPTVFYAMFSADALGTKDEGDWYHYYLNAAASYCAATGQIDFDNAGGINPFDYRRVVDNAIDGAMNEMKAGLVTNPAAHAGWRYANALSYLEGAKYGADYGGTQDEVTRETNIHRQGALLGLQLAGIEPESSWRWYVTKTGSAAGQFDTRVDLAKDTYAILDPWGREIEHFDGDKTGGNDGGMR